MLLGFTEGEITGKIEIPDSLLEISFPDPIRVAKPMTVRRVVCLPFILLNLPT